MNKNFDVLIVGTGVSGLVSAIKLAEAGLHVGIITREKAPEKTNTYWAQGGVIYSHPIWEDENSLVEDIFKASSGTANLEAARLLARRSPQILEEIFLEKANTEFDRNGSGELLFTKEAAHSRARIIYKGDYTGKAIQISLLNYLNDASRFPNVEILTSHTAIDLITPNHHGISLQQRYEENKVVGAYVFDQAKQVVKKVLAKKVVLATGGIGALYLHNSNAQGSRGDGHAMAARAGAQMLNMEFIQFHPTTFYSGSGQRRFLISEALRGEGAKLINSKGEAFMKKYHQDEELAPRDIVARAILSEMIALKDDYVYLDISHKDPDWIKQRFPTIYDYCLKHNLDMTSSPIPVVPAAHYTCGGVKTDLSARTGLKNLFAAGEVACTGLHGANRLASTSLLEGVTFGYIAAESILAEIKDEQLYSFELIKDWKTGTDPIDLGLVSQDVMTIKQTMWNYLGLTRSKNRLARARAMFREMSEEIHSFYRHAVLHDELIGLRNGVEVAYMVLNASVRNKESIGCFYREN